MQNLKIFCCKNDKNLVNFDPRTKKSKKTALLLVLLCKVYNVWPKNVQRRYISWQWRVMQNLKKNWLAVWKMTWGIWQIFTRTLERVKNWYFHGILLPKVEHLWAKVYRGVMCNDNEEWWKIWRGTEIRSLKIGTLMGSFYPK